MKVGLDYRGTERGKGVRQANGQPTNGVEDSRIEVNKIIRYAVDVVLPAKDEKAVRYDWPAGSKGEQIWNGNQRK